MSGWLVHQRKWRGEDQRDETAKREPESDKRVLDRERGKLSREKPLINKGLYTLSYSTKHIPTDAQVLEYIIQRD